MKICSIKKVITGQSRKYGFEVKGEEHTHTVVYVLGFPVYRKEERFSE